MKKLVSIVAALMLAVSVSSCAQPESKPDDSCVKALDVADRIIAINGKALNAIYDNDYEALSQATAELKSIGNQYRDYSQQCRGSSDEMTRV